MLMNDAGSYNTWNWFKSLETNRTIKPHHNDGTGFIFLIYGHNFKWINFIFFRYDLMSIHNSMLLSNSLIPFFEFVWDLMVSVETSIYKKWLETNSNVEMQCTNLRFLVSSPRSTPTHWTGSRNTPKRNLRMKKKTSTFYDIFAVHLKYPPHCATVCTHFCTSAISITIVHPACCVCIQSKRFQ